MDRTRSAIILAILFSAVPALAQEPSGMVPAPVQATEKPADVVRHAAKRRVKAHRIAAPATVPAKGAALSTELARAEPIDTRNSEMSAGERLRIQSALLWSGDYTGSLGGEDPFRSAVKNFQKRAKSKITGVLSPVERANLLAAAKSYEDEFGWTIVTDPSTGVRLGLPLKFLPQVRDAARGTRWSATHGEVQVETFRVKSSEVRLAALFEQEKKQPSNRKIENSALRDDSFYISGMQGLKKFSVRAYAREGEIRGFTLLFDQMMETIVAPVTVAMVSAFSPFPERSSPFAALAKSVEYGNGLVVSASGHIVTDLNLVSRCQVIVAADLGNADQVVEDTNNGLALLRVYGARKLAPLTLVSDPSRKDDVTLVGFPDPKEQNDARKLTEIKARLSGANAIELRRPVPMAGFSGAAALDTQGKFLGMMQMRNFVVASLDPAIPPVRLITAETIRGFLAAHKIVSTPQGDDARAAVVRLICVRQ
jgi:hypothetical protein